MKGSTSISPARSRSIRTRDLVAALDAAEGGAGDAAAGDQQARDDVEGLSLAGDAGDGAKAPGHARRFDRLAHHGDVAGRLEGVVGAEAAGHLEDRLDGALSALEHVGRALAAGQLEPLRREVDADDPLGALQPAAGDRAEADHPRAEDDAGAAGLDRGGVDRRAEAGREAAGEEAGVLERRLRVDLGQGDLRHHRVLGEGRAAHEVADAVALAGDPGGAVGQEALVLLLADRHAEVGPRVEAVDALAALGREEGDDVVARARAR